MLEDSYQQQPTAIWNTARGVWETPQMNLLCGHLELFLEVWPTSGTMRNGVVYAQQMQAHRMEDTEFLSPLGPRSIPTPTVMDSSLGNGITRTVTKSQPYRGLGLTTWAERAHEGNLDIEPTLLATPTTQPSSGKCRDHGGDLLHDVTCGCPRVERRLPTPTVADHASTRNSTANRKYPEKAHGGDTLTDVFVPKLLPTVMANEAEKATNRQNAEQRAQTGQVMVTNVAQTLEQSGTWGQYEPAIRRWESIIGREAPAPTIPDGRDGQQRLSPLLTEWMMGLDEGHITSPEIGISRNDQIKAAGNGVVPQQASLALRYLLKGKTWLL